VTTGARWLVFVLGVLSFLAAAKAHGHQLRLERELAGYWKVTFGAKNPDFVEALWRRERFLFWGFVIGIALLTIAFRALAPRFAWSMPVAERSWLGGFVLHVVLPFTIAFVCTGIISVVRFVIALRADAGDPTRPAGWLSSAMWTSAGWWALTLAMGTALIVLAWRKPA